MVSIYKGVITVIEPDGSLSNYRQRGITCLDLDTIEKEVNAGRLNANTLDMLDLPYNYRLIADDEEIQGSLIDSTEYKLGVD